MVIGLFGTGFLQVLYLGRAPRTKETLPDFREKFRVTRHSRVFRGLTGSQRTPGFWGVTRPFLQSIKALEVAKNGLPNMMGNLLVPHWMALCLRQQNRRDIKNCQLEQAHPLLFISPWYFDGSIS